MTVTAPLRQRGTALLEDPLANNGTAFTADEGRAGLDGLLPPVVETLDQQALRAYEALSRYGDNLQSTSTYVRPTKPSVVVVVAVIFWTLPHQSWRWLPCHRRVARLARASPPAAVSGSG